MSDASEAHIHTARGSRFTRRYRPCIRSVIESTTAALRSGEARVATTDCEIFRGDVSFVDVFAS